MAVTKKKQAKDTVLKVDDDYKGSTIKGKGNTKAQDIKKASLKGDGDIKKKKKK